MSIDLTPLTTLPAHASELIADSDKWTQGSEFDASTGAMCLTGALIRACTVPGDGYIARAVYRHLGRGEAWNDAGGRVHADVLEVLHREITADDLAETLGPQWEPIVALVRRCAVLTEDEGRRLAATRDALWDALWDATRAATWAATWDATWDATRAAVGVLVIRDLIGQDGFTQEHYDLLTRPWAQTIGPVHPDDKPVTA